MVVISEEAIFIFRYITGGIVAGLFLIGMLFYLLNLTGDYKSIQSIAFLAGSFGLLAGALGQTLYQFFDPYYHIYITVFITFACLGSSGYFVVLFYNSYLICLKIDIIAVLIIIIPILIVGFLYNITCITRYFDVKDSIDLDLERKFFIIIDVLVYIAVNSVCYRRFYQFKNNNTMNLLLHQYKMGIITVFVMDAILCALTFIIVDYYLYWYISIAIIQLGLTMEYFLLYRLRAQVMNLIQEGNAY